jgi:hypothetical protein
MDVPRIQWLSGELNLRGESRTRHCLEIPGYVLVLKVLKKMSNEHLRKRFPDPEGINEICDRY